jgi:hypothetical protein
MDASHDLRVKYNNKRIRVREKQASRVDYCSNIDVGQEKG